VKKHTFNNSRVKILQLFEISAKLLECERMGYCRLNFEVVDTSELETFQTTNAQLTLQSKILKLSQ
jgi:hypothetical protein